MNFFLLAVSAYAAFLGFNWRRSRELGEEIRALKAAQPAGTAEAPSPPSPEIAEKEKVREGGR